MIQAKIYGERVENWANVATAVLTVLAAALGLWQYIRFQSRRAKQEAVGRAFNEVVRGLAAESPIERVASAPLTRRFFDRQSEFGTGGPLLTMRRFFRRLRRPRKKSGEEGVAERYLDDLPYAGHTVRVVTGVLRSEPTGTIQKLLADGLRSAPTLANADFQRTNLRSSYWGSLEGEPRVDAHGADFFRADLSSASLRRAILDEAKFVEAHLLGTVLEEADCTETNFKRADLLGASFAGAKLFSANFSDARHIPAAITKGLDQGIYKRHEPVPKDREPDSIATARHGVFISAPSTMETADQIALDQVLSGLKSADIAPIRHLPACQQTTDSILRLMSCGR